MHTPYGWLKQKTTGFMSGELGNGEFTKISSSGGGCKIKIRQPYALAAVNVMFVLRRLYAIWFQLCNIVFV